MKKYFLFVVSALVLFACGPKNPPSDDGGGNAQPQDSVYNNGEKNSLYETVDHIMPLYELTFAAANAKAVELGFLFDGKSDESNYTMYNFVRKCDIGEEFLDLSVQDDKVELVTYHANNRGVSSSKVFDWFTHKGSSFTYGTHAYLFALAGIVANAETNADEFTSYTKFVDALKDKTSTDGTMGAYLYYSDETNPMKDAYPVFFSYAYNAEKNTDEGWLVIGALESAPIPPTPADPPTPIYTESNLVDRTWLQVGTQRFKYFGNQMIEDYIWGYEWNLDEGITEEEIISEGNCYKTGWFKYKVVNNKIEYLLQSAFESVQVPTVDSIANVNEEWLTIISQRGDTIIYQRVR